jgi:fructokinase
MRGRRQPGPTISTPIGEVGLDRVYANGDLTDEALGGSCGNVLVSLAMLQRNVAPVLALGDDHEGERLVDEFSQAGAVVRYIHRRPGLRSPVLVQELNTASGQHGFSFVCPETNEEFPRYHAIGEAELASALPVLTNCSVFYVDRRSESIREAMKMASSAGAIIFFEPSEIEEEHSSRALQAPRSGLRSQGSARRRRASYSAATR